MTAIITSCGSLLMSLLGDKAPVLNVQNRRWYLYTAGVRVWEHTWHHPLYSGYRPKPAFQKCHIQLQPGASRSKLVCQVPDRKSHQLFLEPLRFFIHLVCSNHFVIDCFTEQLSEDQLVGGEMRARCPSSIKATSKNSAGKLWVTWFKWVVSFAA